MQEVKRKRIRWEDLAWAAQQVAQKLQARPTDLFGRLIQPSCGTNLWLTWNEEMVFMCVGDMMIGGAFEAQPDEWHYYRWR